MPFITKQTKIQLLAQHLYKKFIKKWLTNTNSNKHKPLEEILYVESLSTVLMPKKLQSPFLNAFYITDSFVKWILNLLLRQWARKYAKGFQGGRW